MTSGGGWLKLLVLSENRKHGMNIISGHNDSITVNAHIITL